MALITWTTKFRPAINLYGPNTRLLECACLLSLDVGFYICDIILKTSIFL